VQYAVLTRDRRAAEPYARALAPLGLAVIAMPVTCTAAPADPRALPRALAGGGFDAILVASPRAAEALAAAGGTTAPVWAVGPATARALEAAGLRAIVPEGAGDGAVLARAMLGELRPHHRVLVPRAEDGRDEAIEILRGAGISVEPVVAYRTVARPPDDPELARGRELLASGGAVVCGVFAPSQVAALAALIPIADVTAAWVAIGQTTATALREAGAREVVAAASPIPEAMANAVRAVYPAHP
jgi:uroporphyrinogen-III synthase